MDETRELQGIVGHLQELGLVYPSEATYRMVVAMYLSVTKGIRGAQGAGASEKFALLQYIKR